VIIIVGIIRVWGKNHSFFSAPIPAQVFARFYLLSRKVLSEKGLLMDTLCRAVLWIVAVVGGLLLLATVLGVSSEQIGVMILVTFTLGFIIPGMHLSFAFYKYVKMKDLFTAAPGKEWRF
jgi:hypothetical protein